jgi:dynein heavy chain
MKALSDIGEPHREMRMNPKAITAPQMFGRLDPATNDWTDGIFSTLWRRTLKAKKTEHIWLVLDGPVDAIWIENLNSVLDDNKTLTLANGDRIPMAPNCKVIFEPHNIDNASPATVSRNGMVYMSSSGLDYLPIIKGWLQRERYQQETDILLPLYQSTFPVIYNFFRTSLESKMDVLECMIVTQVSGFLKRHFLTKKNCSFYFKSFNLINGLLPAKDTKEILPRAHIERLYVFAIMWSFGAFLELDGRKKLEEFLTDRELQLDVPVTEESYDDTIFDYFVNDKAEWKHWDSKVEEYIYPTDHTPEYGSILVPNVDNVRTDFLIKTISKQNKVKNLMFFETR